MEIVEWDKLHDFVEAAARVLLTATGLPVVYVGTVHYDATQWSGALAIIGLGGANLRGSLVLNMPDELVRASHPAGGETEAELTDWLAELSNLLLGQIKRDLYAYGVTIELSTPVTLSAADFRYVRFSSTPVVHQFRVHGAPLHVVFECVCREDAHLHPTVVHTCARAGDVVLF